MSVCPVSVLCLCSITNPVCMYCFKEQGFISFCPSLFLGGLPVFIFLKVVNMTVWLKSSSFKIFIEEEYTIYLMMTLNEPIIAYYLCAILFPKTCDCFLQANQLLIRMLQHGQPITPSSMARGPFSQSNSRLSSNNLPPSSLRNSSQSPTLLPRQVLLRVALSRSQVSCTLYCSFYIVM